MVFYVGTNSVIFMLFGKIKAVIDDVHRPHYTQQIFATDFM